jgi:hemoglobin
MTTLFDQLGGELVLRAIMDRFVDRVVTDPMIGYLFKKTNRRRLKVKEYEHAALHLGASVTYTGRPIDTVHAPHPIRGGHFDRRLQLLKETLDEFDVPEQIRRHWISHTENLRHEIVRESEAESGPPAAEDPIR